jgi:hypothetical protein
MIVSTVGKSFCGKGPKSEIACQTIATATKGMASSMKAISVRRMLGGQESLSPDLGVSKQLYVDLFLPEFCTPHYSKSEKMSSSVWNPQWLRFRRVVVGVNDWHDLNSLGRKVGAGDRGEPATSSLGIFYRI